METAACAAKLLDLVSRNMFDKSFTKCRKPCKMVEYTGTLGVSEDAAKST